MPCSSVCQFNLYRRSVRVSGSSGAVPCSRRIGKRQFCWLCCRFRFLCRIFSYHFHCACKNNVCFLRYDVGQYRFGTDQSGDGGTYPGSTLSCVFHSRTGADRSSGGTVRRRKDNGGQLDSAFLGCNVRRGGSRRSQCCSDRSACPYGSGGFCIPE